MRGLGTARFVAVIAAALLIAAAVWRLVLDANFTSGAARNPREAPFAPRGPTASVGRRPVQARDPTTLSEQIPAQPEGYRPSGPNKIRCGQGTCTLPTETCCEIEFDEFCIDRGSTCPPDGREVQCDETVDCAPGQVCCTERAPGARVLTSCQPACSEPARQRCAHDAECASNKCILGGRCDRPTPGKPKLPPPRP